MFDDVFAHMRHVSTSKVFDPYLLMGIAIGCMTYGTPYRVECLSAVGGWIKRWKRWGGRGPVLPYDEPPYVDMPFIRCFREKVYAKCLASVVRNNSWLADKGVISHSLEYVTFPLPRDILHVLTDFEYWFKEIQFRHRFRIRCYAVLFLNWQCVDVFGIPISDREELFVKLSERWTDYEGGRLMFSPTPMVIANHFTWRLL